MSDSCLKSSISPKIDVYFFNENTVYFLPDVPICIREKVQNIKSFTGSEQHDDVS